MSTPTIPAGLDLDGMSPDERRQFQQMSAHRALGLLMQHLPADAPIYEFVVRRHGIEVMPHRPDSGDDGLRRLMRRLAETLGFEYRSRQHDSTRERLSVIGEIEGVRIELWQLAEHCGCGCHSSEVTE